MAEKRLGFRVRGSVQGAGFRWWAQCKAVALVLRGVIMNQGDGSVEVHVAGSPEVLAELERWLGMPSPRIPRVWYGAGLLPASDSYRRLHHRGLSHGP